MDEVERKDVAMRNEPPASPSNPPKMKQVGFDTRSREAFELLKLGEAICNLQVDQRKMRLNAEDMRFERDRYKASAAAFQDKLTAALNENARLRDLREVLKIMSQEKEAAHPAQVEQLRQGNTHLIATLRATEEQLEQAYQELEIAKAHMESMRLAFIELTRNLIAEAKAATEVVVH
ncbi:hypothetical protein [Novosphingobium sp. YAF33]|uniref:hypothetical protein n=1 Tax=Novosphingobium sp. YAF33 TaxID=3233082 RepID=UPI003F98B54F